MTGGVDRNPSGPWGGWEAVLGAWSWPLKGSGATLSKVIPSVHSTALSLQLDSGFTRALACLQSYCILTLTLGVGNGIISILQIRKQRLTVRQLQRSSWDLQPAPGSHPLHSIVL